MCMMFFNNLNRMFSQLGCIFVSGSCQMFLPTFLMFVEQHGEFEQVEFTAFE